MYDLNNVKVDQKYQGRVVKISLILMADLLNKSIKIVLCV